MVASDRKRITCDFIRLHMEIERNLNVSCRGQNLPRLIWMRKQLQ